MQVHMVGSSRSVCVFKTDRLAMPRLERYHICSITSVGVSYDFSYCFIEKMVEHIEPHLYNGYQNNNKAAPVMTASLFLRKIT